MRFFREKPADEPPIGDEPSKENVVWETRTEVRKVSGENPHQVVIYEDTRDKNYPYQTATIYQQNDKGWERYDDIRSFKTRDEAQQNYDERVLASARKVRTNPDFESFYNREDGMPFADLIRDVDRKKAREHIDWETRSDVMKAKGENPHHVVVYRDNRDAQLPFKTAEVYLQDDQGWEEYSNIEGFKTEDDARRNYDERVRVSTQRVTTT